MILRVTGILGLVFCLLFFPVRWGQGGTGTPVPRRIVSLGPLNTENVFLLGAGDRLVGDTSYCVRPEGAKDKAKVGSVLQVSVEKILSLKPDLILATGLTQPDQLRQLEASGIPVVKVPHPTSFAEICREFLRLGRLLGEEERALRIVREQQEEVRRIGRLVGGLKPRRVFLQVGAEPLFSSVASSFTNDFIVLGGGVNIMEGQESGTTSYERVIAGDPEVIIIAIMGSQGGAAMQEREKWMRFKVIRAVQSHEVHVIDPDLACSPSPQTFVEVLKTMAALIHPEAAKELLE